MDSDPIHLCPEPLFPYIVLRQVSVDSNLSHSCAGPDLTPVLLLLLLFFMTSCPEALVNAFVS